jgi:hypothetical protein
MTANTLAADLGTLDGIRFREACGGPVGGLQLAQACGEAHWSRVEQGHVAGDDAAAYGMAFMAAATRPEPDAPRASSIERSLAAIEQWLLRDRGVDLYLCADGDGKGFAAHRLWSGERSRHHGATLSDALAQLAQVLLCESETP